MLMIHKLKCGNYNITALRLSSGSHKSWKNRFPYMLGFMQILKLIMKFIILV